MHHFTRLLESRLKGSIHTALKAKLEKVVAVDKYTVQFQLSEPNVAFDSMMAGQKTRGSPRPMKIHPTIRANLWVPGRI